MDRFAWIWLLVFLLGITGISSSLIPAKDLPGDAFTTCTRTYKKIGCFKEGQTKMTLIINDRDGSGVYLNWTRFAESVHSLACRCAAKTKGDGYQYFSIRFWAECWAGRDHSDLNGILNDGSVKSGKCSNREMEKCNDKDNEECVGPAHIEYMYSIAHWSGWQEWGECSKPCGQGSRQRTKKCNVIKNLDEICKVDTESTETRTCVLDECPVCRWQNKRFGIGQSDIPIRNVQTKEDCLSSCLWKQNKAKKLINGVTFVATTRRCYCVHKMSMSTQNNNATFCALQYGLPLYLLS